MQLKCEVCGEDIFFYHDDHYVFCDACGSRHIVIGGDGEGYSISAAPEPRYNRAVKRGMDIYMANAPRAGQFDGVVDRASDHSEYLEYKREIMEIDETSTQEE